jgi:hypothetical protein
MSHIAGSADEYTASFGVASNFAGTAGMWTQSRTESVARSFRFEWDPKSYDRSFRVGVIYQKALYYYDHECDEPPYYSTWVPVGYDGSAGENADIGRPLWLHCKRITSDGRWYRSSETGSSYTLSYGVKFSAVIGIDLSSLRAYNSEAMLAYHLTAGRFLCGDNDYPSYASKIMERFHEGL